MKISELKNRIGYVTNTCSTQYPKDNAVCFVRSAEYLPVVQNDFLYVLVSYELYGKLVTNPEYQDKYMIPCKDPERTFVLFHNYIYKNKQHRPHEISKKATIHKTAIIGTSGMKYIRSTEGSFIRMFHAGNVVVEPGVEVGAGTVIQRGTIDSTIIRRGAKIDGGVYIGHNSEIGENTLVIAGTKLAGSVKIGKRCFIGLSVSVRNGVSVCDDVMIGVGSVVLSDITKPGCYWGSPARRISDWDGEF